MNTESEMVTSTGAVGQIESRTFGRVYLSDPNTFTNPGQFDARWREVCAVTHQNEPTRRHVLRTFVDRGLLGRILDPQSLAWQGLVEAVVPMADLGANQDRYLVVLGQNHHSNELSSSEISRAEAVPDASETLRPTEPIAQLSNLPEGHQLTYRLQPGDVDSLLSLWEENFGWTRAGVREFINSSTDNTWFCGVRNESGHLVAASMAESIRFGDRWFTELTEWAAQVRGVASKMVTGLVAMVLQDQYYSAQERQVPLLVAEMNLFHLQADNLGSPGAGISAGLMLPSPASSRFLSRELNILRHNVIVGQGRQGMTPETTINNFAFGILPQHRLRTMYSEASVGSIINSITRNERFV